MKELGEHGHGKPTMFDERLLHLCHSCYGRGDVLRRHTSAEVVASFQLSYRADHSEAKTRQRLKITDCRQFESVNKGHENSFQTETSCVFLK